MNGTLEFVGPIYCETPLLEGVHTIPFEVINSVSSLVPAFLGIIAFYWLYKKEVKKYELYILSVLLASVGVGSALWHGLRTSLMLTLDVLPGLLFFLLFVFLWPTYLKNRWWGYGSLVSLFVLQFLMYRLIQLVPVDGPPVSAFLAIAVQACVLCALTFKCVSGKYAIFATLMVVCAIIAATMRTVDGTLCGILPFGSHFLWHIFLGATALMGIVLLYKIDSKNRTFKVKEEL